MPMNKIPLPTDPLVRQYYEQYRQQFPALDHHYILQLAEKKAIWERDPDKLEANTVRNLIISLALPPFVLSLFDETAAAKASLLYNSFRCPTAFFLLNKAEQDFYQVDHIIPLLADPSFYNIYAYDLALKGFLKYDIESGIAPDTPRLSWEGLFLNDILQCWEAEIPNAQILEMGKLLGFEHSAKILHSIENELDNSDYKNIIHWEAMIIERFQWRIL